MANLSFSKSVVLGESKNPLLDLSPLFFSSFWTACSPFGHLLLCAGCCGYTLLFLFLIPKEGEWSQLWFCVSVKIRVSAYCAL